MQTDQLSAFRCSIRTRARSRPSISRSGKRRSARPETLASAPPLLSRFHNQISIAILLEPVARDQCVNRLFEPRSAEGERAGRLQTHGHLGGLLRIALEKHPERD